MGTNYYWKDLLATLDDTDGDENDVLIHIGKRSAAGPYCYDCNTTLCKDGSDGIHTGKSKWYEECPSCSKKRVERESEYSAVLIELGFQKPKDASDPTGIQTTSSFTWTLHKHKDNILTRANDPNDTEKCIVDEYGRELTCKEFKDDVLKFSRIEYTNPVRFS